MKCIAVAETEYQRCALQYQLENLGEEWRCCTAGQAALARQTMKERPVQLLLLAPCAESALLLESLRLQPMLAPPWMLGLGFPAPDGCLESLDGLPALLCKWQAEKRLPALSGLLLPEAAALAQALLHALGVPARLRAWEFLPDMVALSAVHPSLMADLSHGLYPLTAQRHSMTAAAVERSLRLCVESTWNRGQLTALERFFGSSVDPERGKPTNREFLRCMQERLTMAAERLRKT